MAGIGKRLFFTLLVQVTAAQAGPNDLPFVCDWGNRTQRALYSVHFDDDAKTGWAVGDGGTMLKATPFLRAPYASRLEPTVGPTSIELRWAIMHEKPENVLCPGFEFRQKSGSWNPVRFTPPRHLSGRTLEIAWNPEESKYRIYDGERLQFRVTLQATTGRSDIKVLEYTSGPFEGPVWKPFWERLSWYHWASFGLASYLAVCVCVLWIRPVWFLSLYRRIPLDELAQTAPEPFSKVLLKVVLALVGLRFFARHPRTLDAWVEKNIEVACDNFKNLRTFKERAVYVPVPVTLQENLPSLAPEHLHDICSQDSWCLLVQGEGGAGKTSLVCQIALWAMWDNRSKRLCRSHRMLPLLIEPGTNLGKANTGFVDTLQGRLRTLLGSVEAIESDLCDRLLRKKRILVIMDGLSEMPDTSSFDPSHKDFPIAALVVTSRRDERLSEVATTTIRPLRVDGQQLSSFVDAYLTQKGVRHKFKDRQFFSACGQLSDMLGDRDVTPLLAKLYAEQLVSAGHPDDLPKTIPDLMLGYVDQLNRDRKENEPDELAVQNAAKVVAWNCLKDTFRPGLAQRAQVVDDLGGLEAADLLLSHLEHRLQLIETVLPARDRIRFSLDPLAEYLAALHLVRQKGADEQAWTTFFDDINQKQTTHQEIRGFLLAVRDCTIAADCDVDVPSFVSLKIAEWFKISPRVVMSYSKADHDLAQEAISRLRTQGAEVIAASDSMQLALDRADFMVAIHSASSTENKRVELGQAVGKQVRIVVLVVGDVSLPSKLGPVERIDVGDVQEEALDELLKVVMKS